MKKTIHDTLSDVVWKAILELGDKTWRIKGINIGKASYRLLLLECQGNQWLSGIPITSMFGLPIIIDESDPYCINVELCDDYLALDLDE